jgi:hypothetical protein
MYKHKNGLRALVVSEEWHAKSLSNTSEGKQVEDIILSMPFWNRVECCLRASQPLIVALRIANGDETPATPEIMASMDHAKTTIKESLKAKPDMLKEVMRRYDTRWENQMQQKLYGAALFLNPGKFFALRVKDKRQVAKLRIMFNEIIYKLLADDSEQSKISLQVDDYEQSEGEGFSMPLAIRDRGKKNPSKFWIF